MKTSLARLTRPTHRREEAENDVQDPALQTVPCPKTNSHMQVPHLVRRAGGTQPRLRRPFPGARRLSTPSFSTTMPIVSLPTLTVWPCNAA